MKKITTLDVQVRPGHVSRAFTIIELLVVIAIIALLTGIVMTNLTGAKGKARDAKRISDMGQIQGALELYFDRCKQYPERSQNGDISGESSCPVPGVTSFVPMYISQIPIPPVSSLGQARYGYFVNTVNGRNVNYILKITLESNNSVAQDGLSQESKNLLYSNNSGTWTIPPPICYNSSNTKEYCLTSN
jgi:prepilin-type N-terminal cleavage/methylation domain-containing protein